MGAFDDEVRTEHPAFGQISISYVSGQTNLFMVDHEQNHFMILRIHKASLSRHLSQDWVFGGAEVVEVALSEVQWARFVASPNTTGVPCTLTSYRDPKTGEWLRPKMPEKHAATQQTYVDEIKAKAEKAVAGVAAARTQLQALLSGGSLKKGDLTKVLELLNAAESDISSNVAFVVESAEEALEKVAENTKAEIDAHIDFTMSRLGERALGDRLAAVLEQGGDLKAIGQQLADAVTEKV